jgi:hypothetical protein
MVKSEFYAAVDTFGRAALKVVEEEEARSGLCQLSLNSIMKRCGVSLPSDRRLFRLGIDSYLYILNTPSLTDWEYTPTGREFSLVTYKKWSVLKLDPRYKNLKRDTELILAPRKYVKKQQLAFLLKRFMSRLRG